MMAEEEEKTATHRGWGEEEKRQMAVIREASLRLPPADVALELLSVGICARCLFRLFGVEGPVYSCSLLSDITLRSVLKEMTHTQVKSVENNDDTNAPCSSPATQDKRENQVYCSVCLGILQFSYKSEGEYVAPFEERASLNNFTETVSAAVKKQGHDIDCFLLEISLPPATMASERAFRLFLKEKYASHDWFKEKFRTESISIKDALKSSIISSLQYHLDAKFGASSLHVRLFYTHADASEKLQKLLTKNPAFKKRKLDVNHCNGVENSYVGTSKECSGSQQRDSDAIVCKALEGLQDHVLSECITSSLEKCNQPCILTTTCYRMPMYIGGRYLKFSRRVSQSRWIIDDERMGDASVEEIIGSKFLLLCRGESYKFHAAGREDIDVRMLGSGRPFLVEVSNACSIPSSVSVHEIADMINQSKEKHVFVRNLKVLGIEAWDMMREGEAEKQKQYAALVWLSRPFTMEDLEKISSTKDMEILQRTPVRVLHRRSPLERKRIIHWMKTEKVMGSSQYLLLHLCTQAGTYIKEFVHGDLGRTHPSIGSILGCRAEIIRLDVTDVKMDCFE